MANIITLDGLKNALSQFLNNLIDFLPIKGFTSNGKSKSNTLHVQNDAEIAMGSYNVSTGDTLLSVGNGTEELRKNAFEVKNDGSIYIEKDGSVVKLQDELQDYGSIPSNKINEL